MNKPKWGTKRQCMKCGARFYDLKRTKIVCPNCDAPFKMVAPPKAPAAGEAGTGVPSLPRKYPPAKRPFPTGPQK